MSNAAPKQKLELIREAWERGDKMAALRIASKFWDRSEETKVFQRGWDAAQNPNFFRQLGKDPEALTQAAFDALAAKFSL